MTSGAKGERVQTLDEEGRLALASQIGERPEATLTLHALRTGDGLALAVGSAPRFRAALVAWTETRDWPNGYGSPLLVAELAAELEGWTALCVSQGDATAVADALRTHGFESDRQTAELFFELDPGAFEERRATAPARTLGPADAGLLRPTAAELGVRDPESLLANSSAAGIVVEDRLVALAYNEAWSERYGDVGVATLERYRGLGFASACGNLVARRVIDSGRIPVWCTGEDNIASRRTAEAIGFREVHRRVNIRVAHSAGA